MFPTALKRIALGGILAATLWLPGVALSQVGEPSAPAGVNIPTPSKNFKPLSGIPGVTHDTVGNAKTDVTLEDLLQSLYRLAIVLGALLAVLKITLAGLKYMGSDNLGNKSGAREDIKSSLFGLLILLSTVLILQTIFGNVSLGVFSSSSMPMVAPGVVPTIAPTIGGGGPPRTVDKSRGCEQVYAGDCPAGKVGVIFGNKVRCGNPNNLPALPGQTAFKPMTQAQCDNTVMTSTRRTIVFGGLVYGHSTVTATALRAMPGYQTLSRDAAIDKYINDVLKPACMTISKAATSTDVTISDDRILGTTWMSETFNFTCRDNIL